MPNRIKEIETLLEKEAYEEALALTERALSEDPDDRSLYVLRGRGRLGLFGRALDEGSLSEEEKESRFAAVKSDFANGFTGSPRDVVLSYKGMMMLDLAAGREEDCIALCEKYREEFRSTDCNYFWASALLGEYEREGDPEKLKRAEKLLREAKMPGRPGRIIRMTLARVLLAEERPAEALAVAGKLLRDRTLLPDSYMLMVQACMALGQPERALPYIRFLADSRPQDPIFRAIRAEVALEAGDAAQAAADAEFCLSRGSDPHLTLIAVRAACRTSRDPEEYGRQLERLRAARPEGSVFDFLETECDILCDLGRPEEALTLLREAEAKAGEEGEKDLCREQIFRVLASMGRYDEALAIVEELGEKYPSPSLDYYRGMILFDGAREREDVEKAREALLKAIRDGFDAPTALIRLIQAGRVLRDFPFLNNLLRKGRLPKWAQDYLSGVLAEEVRHDYSGAALFYARAARGGMDCAGELLQARMRLFSRRGTAPLWPAARELAGRSPFWKRTCAEALAYGRLGQQPNERHRAEALRLCREIRAEDPDYSCNLSLLGQLYLQGWGTQKDPVQAVSLFERAHELDWKGYPSCYCQDGLLAACLEKGEGTERDSGRAKKLILDAVARSGAYVHDNVASMYVFYFLRGEDGFEAGTVRAMAERNLAEHAFNPSLWTILLRAAGRAGLDEKKLRRQLKQSEIMGEKVLNDYVAAHGSDPEFFPHMGN